jgi:hypothetical protein
MKTIDDESPPGAWKEEMKAAPWGYGQTQNKKVEDALASMRLRGLWQEASILSLEITTLRREVEALRGSK